MKTIFIITLALLGMAASASAQTINWQAFRPEQKNLIHVQAGFDYSLNFGVGYARKFNTRWPILANIEYSFPSGDRLFDDLKIRLGGQVEVYRKGGFSATVKAYCPIRRYENSLATLFNFGSEFSGVAGFYRPKWFVAGEFGFDKAVATNVKHSSLALDFNPGLQGGWYVPTGGNFFYGIQTGVSFGATDISLKAGKLVGQDFKTAPFIPYFAQLSCQRRF